jgi:hypothetical protein
VGHPGTARQCLISPCNSLLRRSKGKVASRFAVAHISRVSIADLAEIAQKNLPADWKAPSSIRSSAARSGLISSALHAGCGLVGLVSNRRGRPYPAGRSKDWVKIKSIVRRSGAAPFTEMRTAPADRLKCPLPLVDSERWSANVSAVAGLNGSWSEAR